MLPNVTLNMLYSLEMSFEDSFKDYCSKNLAIFAKKLSVTEFTVKKVTVCRAAMFFERSTPSNIFLKNL